MPSPTPAQRLLAVHAKAVAHFTSGDWRTVGLLTEQDHVIENHARLLRSLAFGDDDYESAALEVLTRLGRGNPAALDIIEDYAARKYPAEGEFVSVAPSPRVITFAPNVFQVPGGALDPKSVAVMMPFDASFQRVYDAIKVAAADRNLQCTRVDNVWEHSTIIQDIFSLIFRSNIVVVDFTGKNPNVMYETGIAHTLGKHVVPISQSMDDVPFDIRHHRVLKYLPNTEGLADLRRSLASRLASLQ